MEISESIACPYCGQAFELVVDTSVPTQQITIDCEICCRPLVVLVESEPGAIVSLDVRSE